MNKNRFFEITLRRALSLAIVLMSFTVQSRPLRSPFLSERISEADIVSDEESMAWVLSGRIDGGQAVRLGEILDKMTDEADELYVDNVRSFHPRLGIATALYDFLVRQKEASSGVRVKKLKGTAKVETNLDLVLEAFIKSLSTQDGFKAHSAQGSWTEKFFECCTDIYARYPRELKEAAKASPTYQIGKKLGFDFCPNAIVFKPDMLDGKKHIHFNYELCRP